MKIRLLLVAIFSLCLSVKAQETKPLKALMVCGGCCHDYENQKKIVSDFIAARANVVFDIVHEGGTTREHKVSVYQKPDFWKGYDVIIHNECFGQVDDVAFVENIANAHLVHGVPAVMLHCSTHSYRAAKTEAWHETLGMTSTYHEKNRDLNVRTVGKDHPIMIGVPEKWIDPKDELYVAEKFWPSATPLAVAYGEDTKKDHPVIWLNNAGKARVFATTLGHNNSTMQNAVYQEVVTRGLLWAVGKLGPDGNPLPGYEPVGK
jgi:uncharacterized protein